MIATPIRKHTTKDDIIQCIKKRGPLSVRELAEYLGLTHMGIRKHMYELQKERYIEGVPFPQQIGRPPSVFRLTELANGLFPDEYDILAVELIDECEELLGESVVRQFFERRKTKLEQKYQTFLEGKDFDTQVETLAKLQDNAGYMVSLEKIEDGMYSFEEANCPIAQVSVEYRQACQCELALFQTVLQAHVERTECLADGGNKCRYLITQKGKENDNEGFYSCD